MIQEENKIINNNDLEFLNIWGAKVHNLKDINLKIPRNQLVVITGVSGSGKSSLAFDTIYAEGQRRYMETFSAYARQFLGEMERPDVEKITGLSPVIAIEQKTTSKNPRSTVGTVTEIYDFLRLLFARASNAYSYVSGKKMEQYTEEQIIESIYDNFYGRKGILLAPVVRGRKGHYRELFEQYRKQGFGKMRIDGEIVDILPDMQIDRYKTHDIELVVDRLNIEEERKDRLSASLKIALKHGNGFVMFMEHETDKIFQYSKNLMCIDSGISYEEPSPNTFSFNSPYGACPSCKGLGIVYEVDMNLVIPDNDKSINDGAIVPLGETRKNMVFNQLKELSKKFKFSLTEPIKNVPQKALDIILNGGDDSIKAADYGHDDLMINIARDGLVNMLKKYFSESYSEKVRQWAEDFMTLSDCPECHGSRLKKESLFFKVLDKNIYDLSTLDIKSLHDWIELSLEKMDGKQKIIATDIIKELKLRLGFLLDVGLDYLTLNRTAGTLSGGESQRIRLATQIGSQLTGITYILDEPSIGLHQRDNERLINALKELAEIGNTVLVVEHDKDIMLASDYLIDLGPRAGKFGGEIVAEGKPEEFLKISSNTSDFLSGRVKIEVPKVRRKGNGKMLKLNGAKGNNLKHVSLEIPLGSFICVTGVSGSGKSTLINDTLYPILRQHFYDSNQKPLAYQSIEGIEFLDKVIEIDQEPIGRTPRSNPVTFVGAFDEIRKLFAEIPESKIRGYKPGRFSFNVSGGRCDTCDGSGMREIEMQFLPNVEVECETCGGKRYNRETLEIIFKGKNINEILNMSVEEASEFFKELPKIYRKIETLKSVGLGYITLGQSATTLSGGEAQRIKLSKELSKKDTGNTIYILDEPTTGLHFSDIKMLLTVLNELVERNNTVLVIEHNMDVIKIADYIVDIGPEGGSKGGEIVASGTPEEVIKSKKSITAKFLKKELKN